MVVEAGGDAQPLFGCRGGDEVEHLLHRVGQGEGFGADLQLARLDPAEIEQFIDGAEQGLAAAARGFGIGALLGIEACIEQEGERAHDAMQRRADFMAHEGQEIALFLIGAFGRAARLHGLTLGADAGGHIMLDAHEGHQAAISVEDRRGAQFIDETLAVTPVIDQFDRDGALLSHRAAQQMGGCGVRPWSLQKPAIAAQDLFRRIAGDLHEGGVAEDDRAIGQIGIGDDNAGGGGGNGERQRAVKPGCRDRFERTAQIGVAARVADHIGGRGRQGHRLNHRRREGRRMGHECGSCREGR